MYSKSPLARTCTIVFLICMLVLSSMLISGSLLGYPNLTPAFGIQNRPPNYEIERAPPCRVDEVIGGAGFCVAITAASTTQPNGRIKFLGFEVTQAIQSDNNLAPLIEGKRTFVRAYLYYEGPGNRLANVRGCLSGVVSPGTNILSPRCLLSRNVVSLNSSPDLEAKRRDISASLNFEIPLEWTRIPQGSSLHLKLFPAITGEYSLLPCDDARPLAISSGMQSLQRSDGLCDPRPVVIPSTSPVQSLEVYRFVRSQPLWIKVYSIPYTVGRSTNPIHQPTQFDIAMLISWLRRAYPTDRVLSSTGALDRITTTTSTVGRTATYAGTVTLGFTCYDVDARLQQAFNQNQALNPPSSRWNTATKIYGLVSDTGGWMRGCSPNIPSRTGSGPTGNSAARGWTWDTDGTYGDWYGGHEIGHLYGRHHPGFPLSSNTCSSEGQARDDTDYPYANGRIGTTMVMNFGFDVGDGSISRNLQQRVYPFDVWSDVMTYQCNQWISDYTYKGILSSLPSSNVGSSPGGGGGASPQIKAANQTVYIVGNINLTKSSVKLEPFFVLPGLKDLTPRPEKSSFSIILLDDREKVLARYPFEPKVYADIPKNEDQIALIAENVPFGNGTKKIEIMEGNKVLGSVTVSEHTPIVGGISVTGESGQDISRSKKMTVNWNGRDADGDLLTYSVLGSPDNGKTWNVIGVDIKDTQLILDTKSLPGGSSTLFRVMATDGVNTAFDDSNQPISIPNKAPQVGIISPYNNSTFLTPSTIILNGYANDLEDGNLDGKALSWTSNRDGSLGYGSSISASNLVPGDHIITLNAKDKNGGVNSTNITIHVLPFNIVSAKQTYTETTSVNATTTNNTSLSPESNETMPGTTTGTGGEQVQSGKKNTPPHADAGPSITVKEGEQVTLDGSNSKDPDGDSLTCSWSAINPDGSQIVLKEGGKSNGACVGSPIVSFTTDMAGTIKGTLTVSDGHGGQDTDTVKVTVKALKPSGTESVGGTKTPSQSGELGTGQQGPDDIKKPDKEPIGTGSGKECPKGEGPDPDTGECVPLP